MAKELQSPKYITGQTTYCVVKSAAFTVWNGSAFESLATANWTTYKLATTEESTTGYYAANMPAGINTAGWYTVDHFVQSGGAAAPTDTCFGSQLVYWSGTADLGIQDVSTSVAAVQTTVNTVSSKLGAFTGATTNSVFGFLSAICRSDYAAPSTLGGTYDSSTDSLQALRDRGDAAWITSTLTTGSIAAAVLTTAMTETYPSDGAAMTLAQFAYLLLSVCAEFSISGTTVTCKKLDGSTTAATYTLNDATNPTSRTRVT